MGTWIFGEVLCRIVGELVEVCFTVSILSLSGVAFERYTSICHSNNAKRGIKWCIRVCAFIWILSLFVCSPLAYAYTVYPYEKVTSNMTVNGRHSNYTSRESKMRCETKYWSKFGLIYVCLHGAFIYLFPLGVMLSAHLKIAQVLRRQRVPTTSESLMSRSSKASSLISLGDISRNSTHSVTIAGIEGRGTTRRTARNIKIMKLLAAVTIIFVLLWTPFVIGRIVREIVDVSINTWSLMQLLVLFSTVTNFFVTFKMSREFEKTVVALLKCRDIIEPRIGSSVVSQPTVIGSSVAMRSLIKKRHTTKLTI